VADFPHFAHPFERGDDGNVKVVEQGTPEHVMSQVEILVLCPVGFRYERPDFGWPWPLFQNAPLDLKALEAAIARFVPDARVTTSQIASLAELATQQIQVEVSSGR
jgi:phage baseplate assembly protein W